MKKNKLEIPDPDDRGVSPVIGVILMVAITVILAAVIASFVLGFGGQTTQSASAGVEVDASGNNANVTVITLGENAEGVTCVQGSATDAPDTTIAGVGETIECNTGNNVIAVGTDGAQNSTIRTNIGN
ncbi:type IV pilin N-terminal domain-containing protein [Halobacterium sp. KA-6]|nr:type IV pilin N-terminal domain-containing protein [Halobacterium sp. KA-6]MCD2204897.1 type IV pilin N-terminal domain-containing protein [Halobacterium sp. KA-6]